MSNAAYTQRGGGEETKRTTTTGRKEKSIADEYGSATKRDDEQPWYDRRPQIRVTGGG